jgi:cytochrome c oxidase assembly protein subunit 15
MPSALPSSSRHRRAVRLWLLAAALLVLATLIIGGATRLTESGLSIVEWKPVTGIVPPLSDGAWQAEFNKYKAIPQYQILNRGMTLAEFATIYWWEWTHRIAARVAVAAFLLPFLWFLWRGWIEPPLRMRLWAIFGLGALQGAVGWWMVASGLDTRIDVSQYRLALHLTLACLVYAAIVWTVARLASERRSEAPARIRAGAIGLLVIVLTQIYLGALVAGLHAGLAYNTWPLIDGRLVPATTELFASEPHWRNFFENRLTVQFDHRMIAYALVLAAIVHAVDTARAQPGSATMMGALALAAAATIQAALGIATLLTRAPVGLALLHQAMAMAVVTIAVVHAARLAPSKSAVMVVPAAASPAS